MLQLSLELHPASSPRLAVVFVIAHTGTLLVLCLSSLPGWLEGLAVVFVLASLLRCLRRNRQESRVTGLTLRHDGKFLLATDDGQNAEHGLLPESFVTPWLTVLLLKPDRGSARTIILTPGRISATDYRRLRARLLRR